RCRPDGIALRAALVDRLLETEQRIGPGGAARGGANRGCSAARNPAGVPLARLSQMGGERSPAGPSPVLRGSPPGRRAGMKPALALHGATPAACGAGARRKRTLCRVRTVHLIACRYSASENSGATLPIMRRRSVSRSFWKKPALIRLTMTG